MAERTPYQRQLQGLRIPTIDFAAEREQVRKYQEQSQALQRMSTFFLNKANAIAKIEGAEYGPEQAPDITQLSDAFAMPDADPSKEDAITESKKAVKEQLKGIGDNWSTFGVAAKDAAQVTTYNDLAYAAKVAIGDLKLKADANPALYPPEFVKTQYESIVTGYASVFDEINPAFARKFRAELNMYAYGQYETVATKFNKDVKDQNKALFTSQWSNELDMVDTWFDAGTPYYRDEKGFIKEVDTVAIDQGTADTTQASNKRGVPTKNLLDGIFKNWEIQAIAAGHSSDYVKTMKKDWDAAILNAAKGKAQTFIHEYAQSNEQRAVGYNNLEQAILEVKAGTHLRETKNADGITTKKSFFLALPKNMQNVLQHYALGRKKDLSSIQEVLSAARSALSDNITLDNAVSNNVEVVKKDSIETLNRNIITTIVDENLAPDEKLNRIRNFAKQIFMQDPEEGAKTNTFLEELVGPRFDIFGRGGGFAFQIVESDGSVIQELELDLLQGNELAKTTHSRLLDLFKTGKITYKDMLFYSDKLTIRQDKDTKDLLGRVKSALKLPSNIILNANTISTENLQTYGAIENALIVEMRNPKFDQEVFETKILDLLQQGLRPDGSNVYRNLAARVSFLGVRTYDQAKTTIQAELADTSTSQERKAELLDILEELTKVEDDGNQDKFNNVMPSFFSTN
jgi:hypothetical protein